MIDITLYIKNIINPTEDFESFLSDYFTGNPIIRMRLEEDYTVWNRLKGKELQVAKQMILENLGHDTAYIRAIGIFRDERGIPLLKRLAETLDNRYCYEKLYSAKVLYDWIGYKEYFDYLEKLLPDGGEYTKTELRYWIRGTPKGIACKYIFMMLEDPNRFVRFCAYGALTDYFGLGKQEYEETKYYTSDEVYANKRILHKRLQQLKERISILEPTMRR
ncbi:MAG: hypothetical protein ACOX6L_07915 [Syntrophomonadaceae bacterium]